MTRLPLPLSGMARNSVMPGAITYNMCKEFTPQTYNIILGQTNAWPANAQQTELLLYTMFSCIFGQLRIQTYNSVKLSNIQPCFLEK